jgi:nicotinamidase-related amidase
MCRIDRQCALLLIDVINDFEFEGAEKLFKPAMRAAARIAALAAKARKRRIPVIYANDNFGRWRSDFREVVEHCLRDGVRGQPLVELLEPQRGDYFVLKPKHSAFFSTTLEMLLEYLEAKRVVLTGISGDQCVLLTAADAYLRDLELFVPGTAPRRSRRWRTARPCNTSGVSFMPIRGLRASLNLARLARK